MRWTYTEIGIGGVPVRAMWAPISAPKRPRDEPCTCEPCQSLRARKREWGNRRRRALRDAALQRRGTA